MNITVFGLFSVILLGIYCTNTSMLKIAHRGFSGKYGDNNLDSFQAAIDNGFDMVELDIQMCKSGEIVVYHDRYIDNQLIINLPINKKFNTSSFSKGFLRYFSKLNIFESIPIGITLYFFLSNSSLGKFLLIS